MTPSPLSSPRLAALRRARRGGGRPDLDRFWEEVRERGTPLIDPIRGDGRDVLVTFLRRGDEATRNVVVASSVLPDEPHVHQLRRVPGTDVWCLAYRMPADLRFTYRLLVNDPLIPPTRRTPEQAAARARVHGADPLNQSPLTMPFGLGDGSVASLPAAPPQPWTDARPDVPLGGVQEFALRSATLENERPVWVYTPPKYASDGQPYGLLLLFDGQSYLSTIPAPAILDNLLAEGAIPPLVTVLVSSIDIPTRTRELPCYPPFVAFLADELLPWVRQHFHVMDDPARVIVGGVSFGGLAAAHAALRRPDLFGNVLSQSGSYWWSNDHSEWLVREYVHYQRAPVRFYLEAGFFEDIIPPGSGAFRTSLFIANRHFRDVLEAKGYELHYVEFNGGHDFAPWRGTLAGGLVALTRGW